MKRSKFNDTEISKGQRLQQQDSDGSGSVVSLQSSSSDEGRYAGVRGRDVYSAGTGLPMGEGDSPGENVAKLQQKLNVQPTQDTLDEIISTMKRQNGIKDSSNPGTSLPLHNDSAVGSKTYNSSLGWNSSPLQMSGYQKFDEKHTRQLKDITSHFEGEIEKICDQLNGVGNNLVALQDALPVKMLEAANHKLEARCNVLEQVCEQMKNKSARLVQANQDLDANCGQLRQSNQNLEVRCIYLEQVNKSNESQKSNLQENVKDLESKVVELAESNKKAVSACQQLEELNQKSAARNQQIEESKSVLEQRYKSCVGDNHKLEAQIVQYQKVLEESKKRLRDLDETITTTKREKETLASKLESLNKGNTQLKYKYEELKAMSASKDELITRLENEMKELSVFVEKTIKEKTDTEGNSKRDKELLERMLVEYDVLARDHHNTMTSSKAMQDKLELSQSEMTSLRETISKLIRRNNILEESVKEGCTPENRRMEQPVGKNRPFTGRKTWDQSTPFKKRDIRPQYQLPSYTGAGSTRDSLGSELASFQPYDSTLAMSRMSPHSVTPAVPDVAKASTSSGRRQDFSSSGAKSSTISSQGKRKGLTTKDPGTGQSTPCNAPAGMVVKETDLVTRFDVVFEDSKSGEEMVRTHTGRTRRLYSEPPQTESSFATGTNEAASGVPGSAYSSVRDGRMLAVDEWESSRTEPRRTNVMVNVAEKDFVGKTGQPVDKSREEENDQENARLMERKFSILTEERKRLESTLSRIPATQKMSKRAKEDKTYLENRLYDVVKDIGTVRDQLGRQNRV